MDIMNIWESPSPRDNLFCQREIRNPHNTHTVAIKEMSLGTMEPRQQLVTFQGRYLQYVQYLLDVKVLLIVLSVARIVIQQICHKVDLKYPVS